MMNGLGRWLRSNDGAAPDAAAERRSVEGRPPICFIVDDDQTHRHFMSLALQSHGIETSLFANALAFRERLIRTTPDLVFLDVPIVPANAMESVRALVDCSYRGPVQLMSSRGNAGFDAIKRIGAGTALQLLPALPKPVDRVSIKRVIREQKLDAPLASTEKTTLDIALREGWIEFWYQPKINLRKRQLAGVELFARVRHPQHGVMSPGAFMDDADGKSLVALTEKSLIDALKAATNFAELGVNQRIAVNVSITALAKLSLLDIVREYRPQTHHWPGLILDVTEDQIASDLSLAKDIAAMLEPNGIRLAIDDFGRGFLPLARLNAISFAELKLDRTYVSDCSTDRGRAAICKTVIELAHNFGSMAVGVGVEKPADAGALAQMGCDLGQGYLFAQPMADERFRALLRQRAEKPVRPAAPVHAAAAAGVA